MLRQNTEYRILEVFILIILFKVVIHSADNTAGIPREKNPNNWYQNKLLNGKGKKKYII